MFKCSKLRWVKCLNCNTVNYVNTNTPRSGVGVSPTMPPSKIFIRAAQTANILHKLTCSYYNNNQY